MVVVLWHLSAERLAQVRGQCFRADAVAAGFRLE